MTFEIMWKAYPVIMVALAFLTVVRFKFIQHGQTNTVLGILAVAAFAALLQFGQIESAILVSLCLVAVMIFRSMRRIHS